MLNHLALGGYIADTVREPLLVLDADFRVMAANRAYYAAFDATPEGTIERLLFDLDDRQWDIPALRTLLRDVLPAHEEISDFLVDHVSAARGRRSMLVNAREILRPAEHQYLILLAIQDVTDRRAAEIALALRTVELERSNRELEQFAAIASHDLHEPLRKIRTYGDLFLSAPQPLPAAEGREHVAHMVHAATRMQVLINEVLALARLSAPYEVTDVALNRTLREVLGDFETAIAEAGATVNAGPLPIVRGNSVHLRQLFQNLLSNALKFRRPGVPPVISIAAMAAPPGGIAPVSDLVMVRVTDNGLGFEPRHAARIFEPLQRLHGRSEYPGTGMGLALARRIVERHGGAITAAATPGEGAAFSFTLPASTGPALARTLSPTLLPA